MINRDEYIQKLKSQIDQWNAEAARWSEKAQKAQASAKAEYERQLENFRRKSEEATSELRRLQNASAEAFTELMRGPHRAMQGMKEAFERARRNFDKK
jgi:lipid II:glycine glycyltransferase (peptidoglycan interpeptide bridge formation enzyme)